MCWPATQYGLGGVSLGVKGSAWYGSTKRAFRLVFLLWLILRLEQILLLFLSTARQTELNTPLLNFRLQPLPQALCCSPSQEPQLVTVAILLCLVSSHIIRFALEEIIQVTLEIVTVQTLRAFELFSRHQPIFPTTMFADDSKDHRSPQSAL